MADDFFRQRTPSPREMTVRREVWGIQVIEVYAEIDAAVVSALDEALDAAILALESPANARAPEAKVVILNLCPVDFLDSQGIRSLLGYRAALKELGGELIVAAEPGEVMRILQMTGVDEFFRVFDSLDKSLSAAEGGAPSL